MVNYTYPFDMDWNKKEILTVIHFFTLVEQAYEKGIQREELLDAYRSFKQIVPSKSEEKQYFRDFQKGSGYSCFHAVKKAREEQSHTIKM